MKKLIAIDGNSLMHRAYYALPSMTAKDGTPTGAIYGFVGMLLKLLSYEPDYLLVAFDMHGPTFRHEQYGQYKAGRRETPEDLRAQFPLLKELLREMGIAICECERYEADDILGTISRIADKNGVDALLVTGDRDALQLINDHTHVLLTKKGITETVEYDEAALKEQYGLEPARMPDLKGLMGDNSDNLPGIPGVGEKTAMKLLQKYGTLENTLQSAEKEKGALRQKLLDNPDSARMSYRLGIIDTEAPISVGLEDCAFDPDKMAGAIPMMNTLELRSLIQRLPKGEKPAAEQLPEINAKTIEISNAEQLSELTEKLKNAKRVAVCIGERMHVATDTETQYDISLGATLLDPGLSAEEVFAALAPVFLSESIEKCLFDSKHARHILQGAGISLKGNVFDLMIADYLLHAIHPADTLKTLCAERGMPECPASMLALESVITGELREKGLWKLYEEVELPLTRVLYDMEREGFAVDRDMLRELSDRFAARIDEMEGEIYSLAGERFNILSTKQLGVILFEKLGLPPQKKTKSGYSTDAEVLEALEDKHPIVKLVLEYRFLSKLKSTFVDGLLALLKNGRVYTSFNQNITATGRISSTEPNLQNIPVRTELGREIRKAFVASPGRILVGADYSQIELRVLAHISGDKTMRQAFVNNIDIHTLTASEIFDLPENMITEEMRSRAKTVNFGIVYGIGEFSLAKDLKISRKEAKRYIDNYLATYSGVDEYMKKIVEEGEERGYVETLFGRRRYIPELSSRNKQIQAFGRRVCRNTPIQGTAADLIKIAMIRVYDTLKKQYPEAKLVLQVHDELILECPESEAVDAAMILKEEMENAVHLKVPMEVDVHAGENWLAAKG